MALIYIYFFGLFLWKISLKIHHPKIDTKIGLNDTNLFVQGWAKVYRFCTSKRWQVCQNLKNMTVMVYRLQHIGQVFGPMCQNVRSAVVYQPAKGKGRDVPRMDPARLARPSSTQARSYQYVRPWSSWHGPLPLWPPGTPYLAQV